jgi:predicted nucleic acid-binding protein
MLKIKTSNSTEMKPTNDKVFLDTNIIVYAHTDLEPQKQKTAQEIMAETSTAISTQVLQETANTLVRKFHHSWADVTKVATEAIQNNNLHVNTDFTILEAIRIAERYGFSFYDSLIISAALECGCNILYSEDLQHGQLIEDRLKIVNPFV